MFDVTMGSFDGAEICGTHRPICLAQAKREIWTRQISTYTGMTDWSSSKTWAEEQQIKREKEFTRLFGDLGLKITIQSNVKVADLYINAKSNHPPTIIKHLPAAINRRISNLSCNEEEFHKASGPYNAALGASGYTTNLRYEQQGGKSNSNKYKKRTRKIIWFNPPFSQNVMTNVAKIFLQLVNKHFARNHALHKIFNRNHPQNKL